MTPLPPVDGAVDLTMAGKLVVRSKRILFAGAVDVIDGGLSEPGQTLHLQVADLTTGDLELIPISDEFATKLAGQLLALVDAHQTTTNAG